MNKSLKVIEDCLNITISTRGNKIFIQGDESQTRKAINLINEMRSLSREGFNLNAEDLRLAIQSTASDTEPSLKELFANNIAVASKKRFIIPKTEVQRQYVEAIKTNDIVIGIGPAGTGKTYLAMAMAINALLRKEVSRIVLARLRLVRNWVFYLEICMRR